MAKKILMPAVRLLAALGLALVSLAAPAAAASVDDFVGAWTSVGRNDGGISYLIVSRTGLGANLQVVGDCQPRDCNWGNVRGTVYASAAGRDAFRNADAITASFNAGFSRKFVILREARANLITVDVYTSFTDRSGRPDYVTSMRMRRERQGPNAALPNRNQQNPDDWWQQQYGQRYGYQDDVFYQQCRQSADPGGVLAGALIGGILGFAGGDGRAAPTIAGIVLGGVAGAALTQNLSCEDRSYAYRSYYDGLNAGHPNRTYDWRNPRSGNYGTFGVGDYYDDPYGFHCATYSQTIYVQGRPQEARGRACQQPDGTWSIVN